MKTIYKIICAIFGHKYRVVGALSKLNWVLECRRCGQRSVTLEDEWKFYGGYAKALNKTMKKLNENNPVE